MRDMPNLDFVRSMAVASVVIEHVLLAFGWRRIGPLQVAWMGVMGVMVFFILTCLVLMWSLERKPHTLDFYIRRFFRIYPLAVLALAAAVAFHFPFSANVNFSFVYLAPSVKSALAQATLLPGVNEGILPVMWSLPYEVGMYLLLPMLFFYVRRNASLWPLLVLWGLVVLTARRTPADGHNFGVALGYFLPGVMAYVGFSRWKPALPGWLLPPILVALWVGFWYRIDFHRAWLFCLALGLLLPCFRQLRNPALLTASRIIARYSYGIYLAHMFCIVIAFVWLHDRPLWLQATAFAGMLAALVVAGYHLVELPMIRFGSRLAARAERRYEQREMSATFQVPALNEHSRVN